MNEIPDYLLNQRKTDADDYDNDELAAARIRLGLEKKTKQKKQHGSKRGRRRRRLRQMLVMPDLAEKMKYHSVEERVLDEKQAEHKVSKCKYCRDTIWLDLFGDQWKAEGGSPLCGKAPFMTHEPTDE